MVWSSELGNIDVLTGGDEPSWRAGRIFDGDLERARKALGVYAEKGIVLITRAPGRADTVVRDSGHIMSAWLRVRQFVLVQCGVRSAGRCDGRVPARLEGPRLLVARHRV